MRIRAWIGGLCLALSLGAAAGCGNSGGSDRDGGLGGRDGGDGSVHPPVEASDPCAVAGYYFDGESDCQVARCPEVRCECPATEGPDGGLPDDDAPPREIVTLSACVPAGGCLSVLDCNRVCEPSLKLEREACEQRIAGAGARSCTDDDDCLSGECREERVGPVCVDDFGCAEDGHCSSGSGCLFHPDRRDPDTGFPTALGECSDGSGGAACFEDHHCAYETCRSSRCTDGLEGEPCERDANCASGFCFFSSSSSTTGQCVGGAQGDRCADDGDCEEGLHCTSGVCYSDAVGQSCEVDEHCASGICVGNRCRSGERGSRCEDDEDCVDSFCVGFQCASGELLAPCSDSDDCQSGLGCARQRCTDGSEGMPCSTDDDCETIACVRRSCRDGSNGATCEADDDCMSGTCANPAGVEPGECTDGEPGSYCIYGSHCTSNSCSGNVCD